MAQKESGTQSNKKATDTDSQQESWGQTVRLFTRFERFSWDIVGILCLALSLMTLLALLIPSLTGGMLEWWASVIQLWFGWGSVWVVSLIAVTGIWLLRYKNDVDRPGIQWGSIIAIEITAFASLALLAISGGNSMERAEIGLDGGRIGWGLAEVTGMVLDSIGLSGTVWPALILGLFLLFGLVYGLGLTNTIKSWIKGNPQMTTSIGLGASGTGPAVSEAPLQKQDVKPVLEPTPKKKQKVIPPQFRKTFRLEQEEKSRTTPPPRDERLPGIDILVNEKTRKPDERNINMTAGLIEKTLAEFGIPANVIDFQVGPKVTQFAVEPGYVEKEKPTTSGDIERHKVRVAQIASLRHDLALSLSAERLRIEAPVPGRPYIGIEVPNARTTVVRLRPILESEEFYKVNSPLTIALGRDVSGQVVVADLGSMPHLLIAGTTGSGKSVCISALTTCLVMNNTPEDLRLVMIDPKMVELVRFNGLPHLYGKVETDLERILGVLRWTVAEMERRYKLLEASRSRNIDTYNRKARRRKGESTLPRLVVMIDELADLMMSAPDQTEHNLVRLAQMARATGIHLVLATQRPSTDVVTGLIKANFPARISFAVASSVDSRVILDTIGAESLLGGGDMLYLPPEAPAPIRSQGVMVSEQEVERVISFWQKVIPPVDDPELPPWDKMLDEESALASRDVLVDKAIKIVQDTQRASASMLQRSLRIGYPRAARLIDELEEMGIVGPAVGGGRERGVLIGPQDEG